MPKHISFRYFKTNPEIIQLAVMLYVRFPLSLRNVEDLLHERGVDVSYESIRYWWHRFSFKKALDKPVNVYQSRSSSGMQWHGIEPLMQV
jgi:putative transposase